MNAIECLEGQHRQVEGLFEQFRQESDPERKQELVQELCELLTIHSQIEHDVFYPAVKRQADAKAMVLKALEEHHLLKVLLKQLAALTAEDETYDVKVKVLCELAQHHIAEEEAEMFPTARRVMGEDELNRLGERLEEMTQNFEGQEPNFTVTMLRETTLETT